MNRLIQTVLFLVIGTWTAFGQERDPAPINTDSAAISPDSLGLDAYYDSIYHIMETDVEVAQSRQRDSLYADSLLVAEPPETKSPSKAIMYALVLPGLGQAYNQKYWKMPIVWAAFGGAGYAIVFNTNEYKKASYNYAQNPTDNLNELALDYWRRNMELSYIALLAVYALQVLDAYVDAQLFSWEVNENLSIGVSPSLKPLLTPGSIKGYSYGLGCNFNIRGR